MLGGEDDDGRARNDEFNDDNDDGVLGVTPATNPSAVSHERMMASTRNRLKVAIGTTRGSGIEEEEEEEGAMTFPLCTHFLFPVLAPIQKRIYVLSCYLFWCH